MAAFILLIEDDDKNRKLARDVLEHQGYEVAAVASAEEGWRVVASGRRPDLILLDIQLPGMSGLDAIAEFRASTVLATVPVIAFTASVMPSEQQRVLDAGFDAFLGKPIALHEFLGTVARLLPAT